MGEIEVGEAGQAEQSWRQPSQLVSTEVHPAELFQLVELEAGEVVLDATILGVLPVPNSQLILTVNGVLRTVQYKLIFIFRLEKVRFFLFFRNIDLVFRAEKYHLY